MQFYLFKSVEAQYAAPFRKTALKQNVLVTKAICIITALVCAGIKISSLFIDYDHFFSYSGALHIPVDFRLISSVLYLLAFQFSKFLFKNKNNLVAFYNFLSSSYPFLIIISCTITTFIQQNSETNTMSMFLLGLLQVAVLWILDLKKILFFTIFAAIAFFSGIHYFQPDPGKLAVNDAIAVCMLVAFYTISRFCFSYHYNYFLQIKTIEQKNREINKINNTQTELLSIVAHDLRSPLNSITGLVDLIKNYPSTEEERNEYYDLILKTCGEADHIINDLVDVARKGDSSILKTVPVNLNDFLVNIQNQWQHRIEDRQLILNVANVNTVIDLNAEKMHRVLDNLINNAVKFTSGNGVITIDMQCEDEFAGISISDDGIGIPVGLQPRLFDRFSSSGRRGLNNEKSYGLGLSICKQIVEQHNGRIWVESKESEGTTFHILLPLESTLTTASVAEAAIPV